MTTRYAIDVLYAWAQLGLSPGADEVQIRAATAHVRRYRFATRARLEQVARFMEFFIERSRFGKLEDSFHTIRKGYHKRAMELHPDRNSGDKKAEERLKDVNAAFEIIEEVHKEARIYFDKDEAERRVLEREARAQALREAEAAGVEPAAGAPESEAEPHTYGQAYEPPREKSRPPRPEGSVKYKAASIPRFIRAARLFYLGRDSIIASRMVRSPGAHHGYVYDIVMLPEIEFNRARLRLTLEGYGVQELTMSKLTPPYIPIDTKEIVVPPEVEDPAAFARAHFLAEYGLGDEWMRN